MGNYETVMLTQECSTIIQESIPKKMRDPESFTIPYSIGGVYIGHDLCDLGASINLMPLSISRQQGMGELVPTTVTLQLADHSLVYPEGIRRCAMKVDKFILPVDFIISDYEADQDIPIILIRPFLSL
ncbi:uncharacterized protein LOC120067651 [Benincasa hispida]|uniref:uncharacterized protein LOC120067651 n=1 Tax=Benincasa hispida TaxID=102211 RepID=UPI001902496D|nr:uncharacterized protein LOC120067651 [Benincasa hispida]